MKTLFSDEPILELPKKSVFLAGPTSRDNNFNTSWRKEALAMFEKAGFNGTVCIPEFSNMRTFTEEDWDKQVKWEWTLLDNADCILFWVPRDMNGMPGLTTNLEFGTYLAERPDNVILAYPTWASHTEWMTIRYRMKTGREPFLDLEDAVHAAITMCNRRN